MARRNRGATPATIKLLTTMLLTTMWNNARAAVMDREGTRIGLPIGCT